MKILSAFLLCFLFLACANKTDSPKEDTENVSLDTTASEIYNAVEQLPEVKSYLHTVDSASGGKVHPQLIIAQKPTKGEPFYWVQVGTTNQGRFVPDYNFMVKESANHEVRFFDTANDTIISLDQWRKSK